MIAFPSDLFEAEIRRLAAERPDYVHNAACEYVNQYDGSGCCLLGQAFENIGIDLEPFADQQLNGEAFDDLPDKLGWDVDPLVRDWAYKVQDEQDSGTPWGEAVAIADGREID